jgi:hypothetical protein
MRGLCKLSQRVWWIPLRRPVRLRARVPILFHLLQTVSPTPFQRLRIPRLRRQSCIQLFYRTRQAPHYPGSFSIPNYRRRILPSRPPLPQFRRLHLSTISKHPCLSLHWQPQTTLLPTRQCAPMTRVWTSIPRRKNRRTGPLPLNQVSSTQTTQSLSP